MWNYKTPGIPDEYFERAEKVLFMMLVVVVVQSLKRK